METQEAESLSIVFVGHVDHGKSTVIGRLLADTGVYLSFIGAVVILFMVVCTLSLVAILETVGRRKP